MQKLVIDLVVKIAVMLVRFSGLWSHKSRLWIAGRKGLFERMEQVIKPTDKVVWFHAASLGEFEEGRPILEKLRQTHPEYKILLTFFSPSGYEIRKDYAQADWVFYLPADTSLNVKRFLDVVPVAFAVFIKYEFWPNLLAELKQRSIPSFAISARFIPNSRFFRWYGGFFRRSLFTFNTLFVQDQASMDLLKGIGYNSAVLAGDPRFDRVASIASTPWENRVIENFKAGDKLFIAGSTCGASDEDLVQTLINKHPETKFLIVPHDMDVEPMQKIIASTRAGAKLYSECDETTDFATTHVLILDAVGMLAMLYRYGNWAYIGGGFIAGIHSVIEATVYGMPAVFGPNFNKNRPGKEMVELGICATVSNAEELDAWFTPLEKNDVALQNLSERALRYTQDNTGATEIILDGILSEIKKASVQ